MIRASLDVATLPPAHAHPQRPLVMVHGSLASLAKVLRQSGPRLPRKAAVELTDAAAERVKMLLDKRHKVS